MAERARPPKQSFLLLQGDQIQGDRRMDISKNTKSISEHIRSCGMTQEEIAEKLDVTQPTVSGIIKCKRDPKLSTLIGLADLLGMSLDELAGHTPKQPAKSVYQARLESELLRLCENVSAIARYRPEDTALDISKYISDEIHYILYSNEQLEKHGWEGTYEELVEHLQSMDESVNADLALSDD